MESHKEDKILSCSLTGAEMKERLKIVQKFKSLIKEKKEMEDGIVLHFEGSNHNLDEILLLIKLERACCTFLSFDLKIQEETSPISLTISGPKGTKEFLSHELGL